MILPQSIVSSTCKPHITSTLGFSSTPSLIITFAPPVVSSAGSKISFTVPLNSSLCLFKILAVPSKIVVCPS